MKERQPNRTNFLPELHRVNLLSNCRDLLRIETHDERKEGKGSFGYRCVVPSFMVEAFDQNENERVSRKYQKK
jgi:hypothetical protein